MDIDENHKTVKRCFKSPHKIKCSLNVDYIAISSTFVLWNKYEILIYENLNFDSASKTFLPEFQIHQLLATNNLLVIVDGNGNVHTTPMKFKYAGQKRFTSSFLPRAHSVMVCTLQSSEFLFSLSFEQDTYFLNYHKLNTDLNLEKKLNLMYTDHFHQLKSKVRQVNQTTHILKSHKVLPKNISQFQRIFNKEGNVCCENELIILSFDRRIVYGCLFSSTLSENEIILLKLHTAPSEISDMLIFETNDIHVLIGLSAGTLIKLTLNENYKTPSIIHLNSAISKFTFSNDSIIYTDGISMWKCEKPFISTDIKIKQFFVKCTKDFLCFGEKILCTTYTNLIYIFITDDEASYVNPTSSNEFCKVDKLFNDSGYLYKILEEIEKSDKLANEIKKESDYITALALSNRPDIMNSVIQYNVIVYDNYEDVLKEFSELTLTADLNEYFGEELFYFLINIAIFEQHKYNDMLSNQFKDLIIHVTLSSEHQGLKITSIRISELKRIYIVIPLSNRVIKSMINVNIKIVTKIPGVHDQRQVLWTVLHQKCVVLNAEHFIRTKPISKGIIQLKEPKSSNDDLIYKITTSNFKNLFNFTNMSTNKGTCDEWSLYVKLPVNYEELFKNQEFYLQHFNKIKTLNFLQQNTSTEFLKSISNISFEVGNDKVRVEIVNDGFSSYLLKITSINFKIASDIRNFYSNLAYSNLNCESGKTFVRYSLYTTVENLQKAIKAGINSDFSINELKSLLEHYQRDVIAALPL